MTMNIARTLKQEAVVSLYKSGHRQTQIADLMEIPLDMVRRWLLAEGLLQHSSSVDEVPSTFSAPKVVYRDPCFYCGIRADLGCKHNGKAP